MIQLIYTIFISNKRTPFPFWWQENLVKHQYVSKNYETDFLQTFLLCFMFLLTAELVKNSHIKVLFIFLKTRPKTVLKVF